MRTMKHDVRYVGHERVRGFQPPWRTVLKYRCSCGAELRLRKSWHGPAPRGGVRMSCGAVAETTGVYAP